MSKKTVGVFIGHGKSVDGSWDCGCTYKKYTEAELVKPITGSCVEYLKGSGVKVVTDYPSNKINMVEQVKKSNSKDLACHVAFHCDWSGAPSGTLPLYVSAKGRKLATLMNKYVMKFVGIKTLGVRKRDDLYELTETDAPAVIFECGSIKADRKTMQKKYDEYGKGAAEGICKFIGVKFTGKKG